MLNSAFFYATLRKVRTRTSFARGIVLTLPRMKSARLGIFVRGIALLALVAGLAADCLLWSAPALADKWPTRAITLIVPYAAGGSMDVAARLNAEELSKRLGQPVVVENRPGGNGAVGMAYVAKSKPDGYTLVVGGSGPSVFNKMLYKTLSYDSDREFTPIVLTRQVPVVLAVDPSLPINNLRDLKAYAQSKNGGLTVGSGGLGGIEYLTGALFLAKTGLKGILISYNGTGPLVTDILGGHIDIGFPSYVPQLRMLKLLNTASAERVSFLPDVKTFRESGLDIVATTWNGLMGPAGLPETVVSAIGNAMNDALKDPSVRKQIEMIGAEPLGGSPDDVVKLMDQEKALWGPLIKAQKISLD